MSDRSSQKPRVHFRLAATANPQLLVMEGNKYKVVFSNESSAVIFLGPIGLTGTLTSNGFGLPGGLVHEETYSEEAWYCAIGAGTGMISGYIIY